MEGYAGITYDLLRKLGNNGIQTPVRIINGIPIGTPRLFEDGKFATSSGKARFIPAPRPWPGYGARITQQQKKYRFWINNGRVNHIWQTLYHHQHVKFYRERYPMPCLEINPADARELSISSGDVLEVRNDVGSVRAMAYITDAVKRNHTFMLFGQPRGAAGDLISGHVDPSTTIPYYKGAWADIRRVEPMPNELKSVSFLPRNKVD